jgi:hypothetical protein
LAAGYAAEQLERMAARTSVASDAPATVCAFLIRSIPSAVRGPVLIPPCIRHRVFVPNRAGPKWLFHIKYYVKHRYA